MAVGGGDERFVVYATSDNEEFHNLIGSGDPNRTSSLFVGGQEGDYPAHTIVDIDQALAAAKTFAETGKLDAELRWESQP